MNVEKIFYRSIYRVIARHLLSLGDVVDMVDIEDNILIVHDVNTDENFRFTLSIEFMGK